ncbi:hypothetical protein ATJ97_1498 [Georgenia soli]|uniref:Uncharacterized protein n=1 Tax=Georgenia soli TaxID=638953 RepID=A0A2A9EJ89_9MICO|nr:hypothetical protein [Georgenia soli]PFG39004.1 hypothetical protein ATJ97_1498 [Georgenia soli]
MYAAIWRLLPGPRWLKVIEALVLALAIVGVLFTWVFPWIDLNYGLSENTVG